MRVILVMMLTVFVTACTMSVGTDSDKKKETTYTVDSVNPR